MIWNSFFLTISQTETLINIAVQTFLITLAAWGILKLLKKHSPPIKSAIITISLILILILPFTSSLFEQVAPGNAELFIPFEIKVTEDSTNSSTVNILNVSIEDIIFLTFLLGTFFMLIKFALGIRRTSHLINSAVPITSEKINLQLANSIKKYQEISFGGLCSSDAINSPVSAGFFNPIIILPEAMLNNTSSAELSSILDHELSHIYHKDQFLGLIQRIAAAIYWWNPAIHILNRELSNLREHIADNYAISNSSPLTYAKYLTSLTELALISQRSNPGILNFSSSHMTIKDRITGLVKKERRMETSVKGTTFTSICSILLLATASVSGYRIQIYSSQSPSSKIITNLPSIEAAKYKKETHNKFIKILSSAHRPLLIKKVAPVYPTEALKKRISGNVLLEAATDIYGRVRTIKVISSANPLLNSASIVAVKQWVYEPYIVNGEPIPVKFTLNVTYSLSR